MNQIKSIQKINDAELSSGILKPELSWHNEYRNQAYIYVGGLDRALTETDVLTIFSQFGVPVDIFLVRDQETGESKGFGYLKYEDQRSTILAIDNLNGAKIVGRTIKVDHAVYSPNPKFHPYIEAVREELGKDKVVISNDISNDLRLQNEVVEKKTDLEEFADPMAHIDYPAKN